MRYKQQQRNHAVHNTIPQHASFRLPIMFGPPPIYSMFKPVQKPIDRRVQMLRSGIKLKAKSSKDPVDRPGLFLRPVHVVPHLCHITIPMVTLVHLECNLSSKDPKQMNHLIHFMHLKEQTSLNQHQKQNQHQ